MATAQKEITGKRFQELNRIFDKYADELANLFGSLFVLSMGSIAFAIISLFLQDEWKLSTPYFWLLIITSIIIGATTLRFLFYFAEKFHGLDTIAQADIHKDVVYVISNYSVDTLIAAGVGKEITDFLQIECRDKVLTMSIPLKPNEVDWMSELKNKFGEIRIAEFQETLLKYTRRKLDKPATDNSSTL